MGEAWQVSQLQEWELETGTSSLEEAQLRPPGARSSSAVWAWDTPRPAEGAPLAGSDGRHPVSRQQSGLC